MKGKDNRSGSQPQGDAFSYFKIRKLMVIAYSYKKLQRSIRRAVGHLKSSDRPIGVLGFKITVNY